MTNQKHNINLEQVTPDRNKRHRETLDLGGRRVWLVFCVNQVRRVSLEKIQKIVHLRKPKDFLKGRGE